MKGAITLSSNLSYLKKIRRIHEGFRYKLSEIVTFIQVLVVFIEVIQIYSTMTDMDEIQPNQEHCDNVTS